MYTEINANIMTAKQLRALIKEIITENTNAIISTKTGTKTIPYKNTSELTALKNDPNISSIETTGGQRIKEMARKAKGFEIVDPDFDTSGLVNTKISGVSLADIIEYVKEHPGVEKSEIQQHFGFVRPQIPQAIFAGLLNKGIIAKMGTIVVDDETGETTIADEPEVPSSIDAEDYFVGNRRGNFFSSNTPEEQDEFETPEEPEIPEIPTDVPQSNVPRMSDEDYNAWMEYMKYKERLGKVKSALLQTKKSRRGGDDLSTDTSNEVQRLSDKKAEYEQRLQSIANSNQYVKSRIEKEKTDISEKNLMERFKKLANIIK